VKYDVIGLSYYPLVKKDYTETIADLENNLKDMASRYKRSDGG
jgi:arabinogalactan endo-1,4-beta-galactosidase